jgi:putative adhesin
MRNAFVVLALIGTAAPAAAQDYHFTREIGAGGRVTIENISGPIEVSRTAGRSAEVSVTKTVHKGDGSLVKAVMEADGAGMRVCTIYLNRDRNRDTCRGDNNNSSNGHDNFDVDMHYVVKIPAGARVSVDNVNGNVSVTGADVDSKIETVNGDLLFEGVGASSLETVNGKIVATFSRAVWEGSMEVQTVNGSVTLTFPADLSAEVSGETVSGGIQSDFPITVEKGFGPKSFSGRIGAGGRRLKVETVNGAIVLKKR